MTARVERIPVFRCTTKGCPWPKDEDAHIPWCLHIEGVEHWAKSTHQHIPKKGSGGNNPDSKIRAILCQLCHDKVDNTPDFDNDISPGENGQLEYILWDTRVENGWNSPLICRPIDSAAGEQSNRERATPAAGPGREEVMPDGHRQVRPQQNDQRVVGKGGSLVCPNCLECQRGDTAHE